MGQKQSVFSNKLMLIWTQSKWTVSEWRPAFLGILNGGPYPEAAPRCGLLLWYSTSSTVQTAPLTFSTRMKHLCKDKLWRTAFLQKVKRALIIHQLKSRPLLGCLKHDVHSILQESFLTISYWTQPKHKIIPNLK